MAGQGNSRAMNSFAAAMNSVEMRGQSHAERRNELLRKSEVQFIKALEEHGQDKQRKRREQNRREQNCRGIALTRIETEMPRYGWQRNVKEEHATE